MSSGAAIDQIMARVSQPGIGESRGERSGDVQTIDPHGRPPQGTASFASVGFLPLVSAGHAATDRLTDERGLVEVIWMP